MEVQQPSRSTLTDDKYGDIEARCTSSVRPTTWRPEMGISFDSQRRASTPVNLSQARPFSFQPASRARLPLFDDEPSPKVGPPTTRRPPPVSSASAPAAKGPSRTTTTPSPKSMPRQNTPAADYDNDTSTMQGRLEATIRVLNQEKKALEEQHARLNEKLKEEQRSYARKLQEAREPDLRQIASLNQARQGDAEKVAHLERRLRDYEDRVNAIVQQKWQQRFQTTQDEQSATEKRHVEERRAIAQAKDAIDRDRSEADAWLEKLRKDQTDWQEALRQEKAKQEEEHNAFQKSVEATAATLVRKAQTQAALEVAVAKRGYGTRLAKRESYAALREQLHHKDEMSQIHKTFSLLERSLSKATKASDDMPESARQSIEAFQVKLANAQLLLEQLGREAGKDLHNSRRLLRTRLYPDGASPILVHTIQEDTMAKRFYAEAARNREGRGSYSMRDRSLLRELGSVSAGFRTIKTYDVLLREPSEVAVAMPDNHPEDARTGDLMRLRVLLQEQRDRGLPRSIIHETDRLQALSTEYRLKRAHLVVIKKMLGLWTDEDESDIRKLLLDKQNVAYERLEANLTVTLPARLNARGARVPVSKSSSRKAAIRSTRRQKSAFKLVAAASKSAETLKKSGAEDVSASSARKSDSLSQHHRDRSRKARRGRARAQAAVTRQDQDHSTIEKSPVAAKDKPQDDTRTVHKSAASDNTSAGGIEQSPSQAGSQLVTTASSTASMNKASFSIRYGARHRRYSTYHGPELIDYQPPWSRSASNVASFDGHDPAISVSDEEWVDIIEEDPAAEASDSAFSTSGNDHVVEDQQSVHDQASVSSFDENASDQHESSASLLDYQIPSSVLEDARGSDLTPWSFRLYKNSTGRPVDLHYYQGFDRAEAGAASLLDERVLGFDLEWEEFSKAGVHDVKRCVSLLQLANESGCHLFHIARFEGSSAEELMPPSLRKLLTKADCLKVGVNVAGDAGRIQRCFGIEMQGVFELSHMYRLVTFGESEPEKVNKTLVKLADQVQQILLLPLPKGGVRTSRWSTKLTMTQSEYAASDAYAGYRLFHALDDQRRALKPTPPRPACWELRLPIELADGTLATTKRARKGQAIITEDDDADEFFDALETQDDGEDSSPAFTSTNAELSKSYDAPAPAPAQKQFTRIESEEIARANEWAEEWIKSRSSSGLSAARVRAYHLWHVQEFSLEEAAALLREPPLSPNTVASYVLEVVARGNLPYDADRLRTVLAKLPKTVHYRYRALVARLDLLSI